MAASQNSVDSTSLRSETQATDSTWSGCTANSAPTTALRQSEPVARRNQAKSRVALTAWRTTETRWWLPASRPKNSTSAMWESQVTGCQLEPWTEEKAQTSPSQDNPRSTRAFS